MPEANQNDRQRSRTASSFLRYLVGHSEIPIMYGQAFLSPLNRDLRKFRRAHHEKKGRSCTSWMVHRNVICPEKEIHRDVCKRESGVKSAHVIARNGKTPRLTLVVVLLGW